VTELNARLFKVSSLASGEVSLVFHVDTADANAALALHHRRGKSVKVDVR
jgi:hypothetical protein